MKAIIFLGAALCAVATGMQRANILLTDR